MPKCTICGSPGTNRTTCPDNSNTPPSRWRPRSHPLARSTSSGSTTSSSRSNSPVQIWATPSCKVHSETRRILPVPRLQPHSSLPPRLPRLPRLPRPTPPAVFDPSSQDYILQMILLENAQKNRISRERSASHLPPAPAPAPPPAPAPAPAPAPTPAPAPPTRPGPTRASPLERLTILHSDPEKFPSRERTEWNYLVSLFMDVQKSQLRELASLTPESTPPDINETVRTVRLTFPDGHTTTVSLDEIDHPKRSIPVPLNFLGISEIPFVKIGSGFVRLALPQLIQIEKQRLNKDGGNGDGNDVLEILQSIQAHLPESMHC